MDELSFEEYQSLSLIIRSQKREISTRKSTRIEKKREKILVHDLLGTNLGLKIHSASRSEEDLVVVIQEEGSIASPSWIPNLNEKSEWSPTPDFVEEVLFGLERDNMPASTRFKYSRF